MFFVNLFLGLQILLTLGNASSILQVLVLQLR